MTHFDLFIVRIWHQLSGGFRASVRKVDEEETRHFSQPEEVTRFLESAAHADLDPADPPPGGPGASCLP